MTIYCDKSGYTGADLLEKNQPHFVFSGVSLTEDLKQEIKDLIHSNYRVQGEIKGNFCYITLQKIVGRWKITLQKRKIPESNQGHLL